MKQKELKNLAKQIAKQELIIQNPESSLEERGAAECEIERLSSKVMSFEDMDQLDEMILEILSKKS